MDLHDSVETLQADMKELKKKIEGLQSENTHLQSEVDSLRYDLSEGNKNGWFYFLEHVGPNNIKYLFYVNHFKVWEMIVADEDCAIGYKHVSGAHYNQRMNEKLALDTFRAAVASNPTKIDILSIVMQQFKMNCTMI